MITKMLAKISGKRVESAMAQTIQAYLEAIDLALKPVPKLAGEVTEVLVKHRSEIEAAIKSFITIKDELQPIIKKFSKDMKGADPAVNALWEDWSTKMDKLFK